MRSRSKQRRGLRILALAGTVLFAAMLPTPPVQADDECFPLHTYRKKGQADLDLAEDLEARRVAPGDPPVLAGLENELRRRLEAFQGLVDTETNGKELEVELSFRPYAYQQHFHEIARAFKRLKRLRRYIGTDPTGLRLNFLQSAPPAFRERWGATLGCVNDEVTKHGLGLNRKKNGLSVDRPERSKHTRGRAVDLSFGDTGLSDEQIDRLACEAGLHRKGSVHFEMVPRGGTKMCKVLRLQARPAEGGQVTASPAGPWFARGDEATVTATASSGYTFRGWTVVGAPRCPPASDCSVTMNRNVKVIARFKKTATGGGSLQINSAIANVTGETATSRSFEFVLTGTASGPVGAELFAAQDRPLPEELTCAAWTRVSTFPPGFRREGGQPATCAWSYRETISLPKVVLPVTIEAEMRLYDPVKRKTTRITRTADLN